MDDRELLLQPHLTVVSSEPDFDLREIAHTITHSVMVDGRIELEMLLGRLLSQAATAAIAPKTLDLIGHTRSNASLLALGGWVIDIANPITTAFFRGLAEHDVLPRLGIRALRLLGCNSAGTAQGRATLRRLGQLLGLEVYGTKQLLHAGHWDADGFRACWSFLLEAASEMADDAEPVSASAPGAPPQDRRASEDPYPRLLDIDALPAVRLGRSLAPCPQRIADTRAAHQILQLVRRREGARMPGLLAAAACELALPASEPGLYHVAHVLLSGEFLRFYPDGVAAEGIVFPVSDAGALRRLIAGLAAGPALTHRARSARRSRTAAARRRGCWRSP